MTAFDANQILFSQNRLLKAIAPTWLKSEPIPSSLLPENSKVKIETSTVLTLAEPIRDDVHNHAVAKFTNYARRQWYVFKPHWQRHDEYIKVELLRSLLPFAKEDKINTYHGHLNICLKFYQINTYNRFTAFLGQLAHESGSFNFDEELASGAAYEGRKDLGNNSPGDGTRYKGRGLIQLTGKHNYSNVGKALGLDLVSNPDLAKRPDISMAIAGHYWVSRNLNAIADLGTVEAYRGITLRINGGLTGLQDRINHWERIKKVLKDYLLHLQ